MPNRRSSNEQTASPPTFEDQLAENAPAILLRMNEVFDDALLLIGRVLGGIPAATAATAVGVDGAGLSLSLQAPDGEHRVRIAFADEVRDVTKIGAQTMALVVRARTISGEDGETSAERQIRQM